MVQEECVERTRLIDAYGERAAELARLIQTLRPAAGDIGDSIVINQARSRCDEAWQALEQHVSEHLCGSMEPITEQIKG